jgi:hypothetical protein
MRRNARRQVRARASSRPSRITDVSQGSPSLRTRISLALRFQNHVRRL